MDLFHVIKNNTSHHKMLEESDKDVYHITRKKVRIKIEKYIERGIIWKEGVYVSDGEKEVASRYREF